MSMKAKYSLWEMEHESIYTVTAIKIKDTNSGKEVDKWMDKGGSASFYREEDELPADYLQTFSEN
jgi:hypothetical protein